MDNQSLKITVAVLLLVIVGGGCCCIGGFGWFVSILPEAEESLQHAIQDGIRDGRDGTTVRCIDAAYIRASQCGTTAIICNADVIDYTSTCLAAVPEPDMTVCVGAPRHASITYETAFADAFCSSRGWGTEAGLSEEFETCIPVVQGVESYCAGRH